MATPSTPIYGIDLGTTNSCIAYIDEYGQAVVIANAEGELTTPSVVQFDKQQRIVGREAKATAALAPDLTIEMIKRQVNDSQWRFTYQGKSYTPEEISAYILRKVVQDAEQQIGQPITDVVITCPAYFGIGQREATARAGMIAGLQVREILSEPIAAAIAYGLDTASKQTVMVYDLGGGTFDVTVMTLDDGNITVVATGGDHFLGGRDWDEVIVLYLAQQWQESTGSSDDPIENEHTLQLLWSEAEKAKCILSVRNSIPVSVVHQGQQVEVQLTRAKFEELSAHLLEQTIAFTRTTLTTALEQKGIRHIDQIVLVGGSTRMPQVAQRLAQEYKTPLLLFDPDEAVAKGAAIYAQKLRMEQDYDHNSQPENPALHKFQRLSIVNVASHSFGIIARHHDPQTDQYHDVISNLVYINEPLPSVRRRIYTTSDPESHAVALTIIENNERIEVVSDLTVGQEIMKGLLQLPPDLPPHAPIEVTFELNRQGRLHVIGREPSSQTIIEIDVEADDTSTISDIRSAF